MKKFQVGQEVQVNIHGLGSHGEGVGYYEGYTLFIEGALPEETVMARLTECKKKYGRAELVTLLKRSPHRTEPICPLFGTCGGCQLMHLSYTEQIEMKRQKVFEALKRIGGIENPHVSPCTPSPQPLHYRNKIQLPVQQGKNGLSIGLYTRSSHDLVEVETCYIHSTIGEEAYHIVKKIIQASNLTPYDSFTGKGELRHILIKSSLHTQGALVILVTQEIDPHKLIPLAQQMMRSSPYIKGVIQNLNTMQNNVILGEKFTLLSGESVIQERLGKLLFNISAASFFQVNSQQAERLYAKALELAALTGKETVLDCYCGVGTLSLYFAEHTHHVIGVECVPEAIENAKENAVLNTIKNAEFICADTKDFIKTLKTLDLVILNPPRKGCEEKVLEEIGRLAPQKIIYISCDPATLARDIATLSQYGYSLKEAHPFDMFPQTAHVECVAKLERNTFSFTTRIK